MSMLSVENISVKEKINELKSLNKKGDNTKIDSKKEARAILKYAKTANIHIYDEGAKELLEASIEAILYLHKIDIKKQDLSEGKKDSISEIIGDQY